MSRFAPYSDIDALKCLLRALYGEERDELACELLRRFGDIRGVFSVSYEALCGVDGVTERVALFLSSVLPLERQAVLRDMSDASITSRADAERFLRSYFFTESTACDAIVSLDERGKIKYIYKREAYDLSGAVAELCKTNTDRFVLMRFSPAPGRAELTPSRISMLERLKHIAGILSVEFAGYAELASDGTVATYGLDENARKNKSDNTSVAKKD